MLFPSLLCTYSCQYLYLLNINYLGPLLMYTHAGPLLAFPVQNLRVSVTSLSLGSVASLPVLSSCVADCVSKALREAEVQLLEPYTSVVVTVPEEHLGAVLSDLTSQRRGQVKEVASLQDSREITAFTPLACLMVSI